MSNDWIFTEDELRNTPSQHDGMKYVDELILRRKACDFIEKMTKKEALDLPKLTQSSASLFLHRFYMRQSFVRYDKYLVAAACVLLASKSEETPKKIVIVAREYISIRKIVEKDQVFAIQKHDIGTIVNKIASMEGIVLHSLAYDLTLAHPYKFLTANVDKVMRLLTLPEKEALSLSTKIKKVSWTILNDSVFTCASLRFEAVDLATAAVYLGGLYENYIPEGLCDKNTGNPWWEVLSPSLKTLQDAASALLEVYTAPYIRTQVLNAGLAKLVYMFHPVKPAVKSPALCSQEADSSDKHKEQNCFSTKNTSSPLCVTSPECGGSQGRSPYDYDLASDNENVEKPVLSPVYEVPLGHGHKTDESSWKIAHPYTPKQHSSSVRTSTWKNNASSSADMLCSGGRKRSLDVSGGYFCEKKKMRCV